MVDVKYYLWAEVGENVGSELWCKILARFLTIVWECCYSKIIRKRPIVDK